MLLAGGVSVTHAQNRVNVDSATRARQQALEIMRVNQKRSLDSARTARQHSLDSMKAARQIITDSLQAMRKYRESRHYRDSVTNAREERVADMREAQRARIDSMKDARQRVSDSLIAARMASTEGLRAAQKRRTDSLAAIKAYKTSKRAADSIAIARKARTDSLQQARKAFSDSLIAVRKVNMEQLKAARKATTDSLTAVRKQRTDSLGEIRKQKAAQTAKQKDNKDRQKKVKEKEAEQKANFAIELKIKKKRSVYSNENMLKKKWNAPRKVVQNTFTRFNYYFNANRKMEEAEANMTRSLRDKWDERIPLFNFDPAKDSTVFAADMDSVIQKASLGIQIHDPRTKWGDDLYLLLGRAYFYKGDPDNAEASFRYIVALQEKAKADAAKKGAYSNKAVKGGNKKEAPSVVAPEDKGLLDFMKHQPATNQALLWLARTYTEYGRLDQAESILDLLGADPKLPESLKGELALENAYLAIKQHNDKRATEQLAIVSADKSIPTNTRRRAAFLGGQILQDGGDYTGAAAQYARVSELNPKIDMDFYARRNRAYSLMSAGGVQKEAIASLKSMLSDGKFSPYYEQIYYVLGRLSANAGDNPGAVAYLQKGINAPKTTKKQKAVSFAALGNIYFNTAEYDMAKVAFDSAGRYATYSPDDSGVALAIRRSLVVDKIATPSAVIRKQDSLLALGKLSEKEQRAVVRRYIRRIEEQQKDSAFRAENAGINAAAVQDGGGAEPGALTWYFGNPVMMQQGLTEFRRKWGNRPLADNWRRSSALAAAGNRVTGGATNDPTAGTDNTDNADVDANGLPTEEALMAYIPRNAENRAAAVDRQQRSYIEMANAYLKQFEDYTRASATLDSMDKRWPSSPYSAEAAYTRYLIALRRNNLKEAQSWVTQLQTKYAGTKWAELVAPAGSDNESGEMTASVGSYYDATYDLLQQRKYGEVLSRSRNGRRQYQDEVYGNRFRIMEAMAYAGTAQYRQADTILSEFIRTHAGDPLQPWAMEVLKYVNERKQVDTVSAAATVSTLPGAVGTNTLPASITAPAAVAPIPAGISTPTADTSGLPVPAEYTYKPQEQHYFVFAVNRMEPKAMGVKAGINDMNTFKFGSANLESAIEPMQGGKAIIVVKPFKNSASAKIYLAQFRDARMLLREYQANEYQTFVISASNYRKLMKDQGIGSYLVFYRGHY